jgi:hypothetical protein
MNYEIYGWLATISLFAVVALLLRVTWMVAVENGYDKGFKSGYKRGQADIKQVVSWRHPSLREKQLKADNDYLMDRVVTLWDRENS